MLIIAEKELNNEPYSIEISVYERKLYISAFNMSTKKKFIVEVPESKCIHITEPT